MKRPIVFLLAIALCLQTLVGLWVVLSFDFSRSFIATELCEQKDVADNCCQGSCYLKKQLSKTEAETQEPKSIKQAAELVFSFQQLRSSIAPTLDRVLGLVGFVPVAIGRFLSPKFGIFHPPKAH